MFNHLNSLMREFADVCAFRNESSYQFVCIFVWTSFPGTVWMSIKYFRAFALYYRRTLDSLKIKVFTAIVTGNCFEGFPEFFCPHFSLDFIKFFYHAVLRFALDFAHDFVARFSLCQCQKAIKNRNKKWNLFKGYVFSIKLLLYNPNLIV